MHVPTRAGPTRRRAATSRRAGRRRAAPARPRAAVDHRLNLAERRAARPAPRSTLISSGAPARDARTTAGRVASRIAPGHHLLLHEPEGLAALKASLGIVARGRRDGAGAHALERLASIARAFSSTPRSGSSADRGRQPGLLAQRDGTTSTCLSESSAARSAAMTTLRAAGQHYDLLGRRSRGCRKQLIGGWVERGTAVDHMHAELAKSSQPAPASRERPATHPRRAGRRGRVPAVRRRWEAALRSVRLPRSRSSRSRTCTRMSATSRCETSPASAKTAVARVGLVGVHVDLQRGRSRRPRAPSRRSPPAAP